MKKTIRAKKTSKESQDLPRLRNLQNSRREILDVAFMEVYTKGFQGVSIDDIVKKTSMTKGGFYHHFPTKLDMGYALVEEVIRPMILHRWIDPLSRFENPLDGILLQMKLLMGKPGAKDWKFGCPLNNLVQEMSPVDSGFKEKLQVSLEMWISGMEVHLRRGRRNGFIRTDVSLHQIAQYIVMNHEGFYGMLKALPNMKTFNVLYDSLEFYFKSLSPKAVGR